MTAQQAKRLARHYAQIVSGDGVAIPRIILIYIVGFSDRMQVLDDEQFGKIMRWLGFIQGALWAVGYFSVDELKEHSRQFSQ